MIIITMNCQQGRDANYFYFHFTTTSFFHILTLLVSSVCFVGQSHPDICVAILVLKIHSRPDGCFSKQECTHTQGNTCTLPVVSVCTHCSAQEVCTNLSSNVQRLKGCFKQPLVLCLFSHWKLLCICCKMRDEESVQLLLKITQLYRLV